MKINKFNEFIKMNENDDNDLIPISLKKIMSIIESKIDISKSEQEFDF